MVGVVGEGEFGAKARVPGGGPLQAEHLAAKLAAVNPERIKIPDTDHGHRLREALRAIPDA
ncbi:hypothetical protein [Streptomyces longisporoflavus]|uniref:Uncharacterized protein n=1 Tax=Streptomyces longisporoflavus TaxID=28044 RepID=A0ABW7R3L1_9ACTN